jgi:dienelactone hydrolase
MRDSSRRATFAMLCSLFLWLCCVASRGDGQAGGATFTLPPPANAAESLRLAYYAYDRSLPLNADTKPLDDSPARTRYALSYDSAHDQRVTAILALPKRFQTPFPAILLVHGSGGNKDVDYIKAASEVLTSQGYATLSIDTQYRGDRARPGKTGELQPDSYTMRDAWVQTVIDLRRAVDYLQSRPDIDKDKIGYLGFSMGGMLGAVLGGVEARVRCFFLAVPGGGIVNAVKHIDRYPLLKARFAVQITPEVMQRVEEIADVIDPIYYVGRILPRPLRIVVGKHDEIIPAEMSTALIEAAHAKEGEQVLRVDSGHVPPLTIVYDIRSFFLDNLGKPTPRAP